MHHLTGPYIKVNCICFGSPMQFSELSCVRIANTCIGTQNLNLHLQFFQDPAPSLLPGIQVLALWCFYGSSISTTGITLLTGVSWNCKVMQDDPLEQLIAMFYLSPSCYMYLIQWLWVISRHSCHSVTLSDLWGVTLLAPVLPYHLLTTSDLLCTPVSSSVLHCTCVWVQVTSSALQCLLVSCTPCDSRAPQTILCHLMTAVNFFVLYCFNLS